MPEFLQFESVTKHFDDVAAVVDVSFSVRQGEIFALLGPSGCGKTTLLRMLAGFLQPDAGRIFLEGNDLTRVPPEQRPINTVFQSYALFPHLSVRENIAFGLKIARRPLPERNASVDRMLELVDLATQAGKKPDELSGGQKQRVALARALVNKPRVLLLDEPLAALDLKLRQRLLVELDDIHDHVGTTFIYVTHDQGEAMAISDRLGIMREGRIDQIGTPAEVYEAPANRFVASFVGDTNLVSATVIDSVDPSYSRARIENLADVRLFNDRPLKPGEKIDLSLRPEKIRISITEPAPGFNRLEGVIEDRIYLGAVTRFWVRCGAHRIAAELQHSHYLLDEPPPTWNDKVFVSWRPDDAFIIGASPGAAESAATAPAPALESEAPD